jgi:multidrug resistance efflux pump
MNDDIMNRPSFFYSTQWIFPSIIYTGFFLMIVSGWSCQEEQVYIKPTFSDLTESIYASVTIQPEDYYTVYATRSGILESLEIEEGNTVEVGQILARINTADPQLTVESAALGVELSRENYLGISNRLSTIVNEIEQSEEQLQLDSINYFRQKNLWQKNIGSKSTLESRQLQYQLSQKRLEGLKQKYKQTEVELANQYKRSQNQLQQAKTNLDDYLIRSKMSGLVYQVFKESGELILPQEPLAQIGKSDQFFIEMRIDEVDIAKVKEGQKMLLTLDAYGDQVFEGRITKIYPQKESRTQTFRIEGAFVQAPPTLYAGLSGEANIIYAQRDNVLSIPLDYLIDDNKVKTLDGEKEVKTGVRTMSRIEITSGIDTATAIIKP